MERKRMRYTFRTRASPHNDAHGDRLNPATSMRGLPGPVRARLKTLAPTTKIRFANWNIGTLTGRSTELAAILARRKVAVAFLQETRWKANRSRNIGHGYKLIYTGSSGGENGVAVVLAEHFHDSVLEVRRICDRLMVVRLLVEGVVTHLISAYAPQVGCSDADKTLFWDRLGDVLRGIPLSHDVVLGGDLNGHVGEVQGEYERVHGGYGYGRRNAEGETILRTCTAADLAVVNTFFKKKTEHLITYRSGRNATQIDYLLTRRSHISRVANCKVIPGECLTAQHRLLVMDLCVKPRRRHAERCRRQIKWWLLDQTRYSEFDSAAGDISLDTAGKSVQECWKSIQTAITKTAKQVLGVAKGGRKIDRETWWWDATIQGSLREKKALFKTWQATKSPEDRASYKTAKRAAKKAVARARRDHLQPLYAKLDTPEGHKLIYKLARSRAKAAQDITRCCSVNGPNGELLYDDRAVKERWRSYFHDLLNTQHREVHPPEQLPNHGLVPPITPDEVLASLRHMENRKAVGPDEVPIEAWKALGARGVCILTNLYNRILSDRIMPDQWRLSIITPVHKGKGSVQDCGNYRGIKVTSHTMKLFERIIDTRIREECTVSDSQYGFQPGRGTMDPIFALRILMEKHREKNMPLHFLFLDLQKAFDCVPREMIWWALRSKLVPETYVEIVRDMYRNSVSIVRTAVGDTTPFPISVGVHQGSVLSPYLFSVILDELSASVQKLPQPWLLMYADDIALVDGDKGRLTRRVHAWREALENGGLKLNVAKTRYMACNSTDLTSLRIGNDTVERTDDFRYLGSVLDSSGDIDRDIKARISAAWAKWREVTGVICDPKMPVKLKGQVYKTIIRPVLTYGSEAWPVLERHRQLLHVTEMNMLRWMCGVTRKDHVRNTYIRGSLHVRDIADKLQESRLRWYGHVLRRPASYVGNKCLDMTLPGTRSRGRPKKRWLDVVQDDMRANGLVARDAEDRAKWRRKCRKADPGFSRAGRDEQPG